MSQLFSLQGRVAVVTGASRGLGLDFARTLAEAGATVVCVARSTAALEAAVEGLRAAGGTAAAVTLDITDEAAIAAAVPDIIARHGRIDVLVNNAGIIYRAPVLDTATDDWRRVLDTDLTAPFLLARAVGRHMLARRYGRIVNIASVMGVVGRATVGGYVAAKHGLIGLTRTLAAELGPDVTVNCLSPGYIRTELNVALQQDRAFNTMLETRTASGRWGTPADLRGALLLLASDAGAYITGQSLVVDGGLTSILA
ncbi:glucose 1-dehydrogenase [Vineibacter terrae]|uniref:SDR family NAD(P)-dependent oxidoreductase n=1 Tax=Vineibacter terrae TaxID=2586908 RepID=UPI002E377713|nr:glucose 1-dehydrogenase [Vineibacter terrae]HEX2889608.1 glucose 1-dehydrogenase [Vineibacter terrae]